MAGRPKVRADMATLRTLTVGDADSLFDRIANGELLSQVAAGFRVGRTALNKWIDADPDRQERYKRAREQSASTFAEQAVSIADDDSRDTSEQAVQRDKLRIDTRRWIASRWDKVTYGEQRGAEVNISLGSLHIDALRAANPPARPALPPRRVAEVEAAPVVVEEITEESID